MKYLLFSKAFLKMRQIKLLLLADANSPHTAKWAEFLAQYGSFDIHIFSLTYVNTDTYSNTGITVYNTIQTNINKNKSGFNKLKYLIVLPKLYKLIKKIKPDIIHSHYASSYGLLGSLCCFHPFIISAWGSDIFEFPRISFFHRFIIKYNFKKADKIISTSKIMAEEMKKYTSKDIAITPFGVDVDMFEPKQVKSIFDKKNELVIGTIKSLEPIYGVDYLIKAFSIVCESCPQLNLRLLIVGGGSLQKELIALCTSLKISDKVVFTGYIKHNEIANYYNMLDINVVLSNSESFGVAVLEASACGKPVVVSNVGGLPEVVDEGITGFIVPPANIQAAADAIEKLIKNDTLRKEMGNNARKFVEERYNWKDNAKTMIDIYNNILTSK